jgi:hypothetical protein
VQKINAVSGLKGAFATAPIELLKSIRVIEYSHFTLNVISGDQLMAAMFNKCCS